MWQRTGNMEPNRPICQMANDAILNDPDARFKLESVLKMKVRHKKDEVQVLNEDLLNDISQIKVPKSNKDCRWNFKKARCEPKPGCDYKYRFGDRSLHKSCRLSAQKQPTSDAECLWNYKKARCHQPLYCARRCKPGKDWTLDQCCKLRTKEVTAAKVKEPKGDFTLTDEEMEEIDSAVDEVLADLVAEEGATEGSESIGLESDESDESSVGLESDESDESSAPPAGEGASAGEGEVEGNCQSPSDRTLMKRPNLSQDLEDASRASLGAAFGFPPVYLKRDKVLKKFVELGMSEMCASCFVDITDCGMKHCWKALAGGGATEKAKSCMEKDHDGQGGCQPNLRKCSGLSNEELPEA